MDLLLKKYKSLSDAVPVDLRKYYHLNSVLNFCLAYDQLKSNRTEVYERLCNYFDLVKGQNVANVTESLELFNSQIKPLGEIFENQLGFVVFVKPWILSIWSIFTFTIVYALKSYLPLLSAISLLYLGYTIRLAVKVKKRKVYAFLW